MKKSYQSTKKQAHAFLGKIFNWKYCTRCGLLTLRNEATRKAMAAPCRGGD